MSLRKRLFARFYDRLQRGYEERLGDRRRRLLEGVGGRVLELGPGTGVNFPHYPSADDIEWHGVEPNPTMRELLLPRAHEHGFVTRFCELADGNLSAPDSSFDCVVSTLVLCSVPDVERTLEEIRRVLRPGGRFVFMEHVAAAPRSLRRGVQHALTPCWRWFADGCRLNRETDRHIDAAGFARVEMERFHAMLPHVSGTARRGS